MLDIRATLRPGSASRMGLKVLTNANGDETVVSYDVAAGTLSIDRTKSGAAAAALAGFPGVHSAPVALRDGRLNLRILVDRSLVEVFAQGGERTIADQVYPTPGSDGLKVFADGGTATLETLDIRELRTTWGAHETSTPGSVGGTVPATLSLTLGPAADLRGLPARRRRATTRRRRPPTSSPPPATRRSRWPIRAPTTPATSSTARSSCRSR